MEKSARLWWELFRQRLRVLDEAWIRLENTESGDQPIDIHHGQFMAHFHAFLAYADKMPDWIHGGVDVREQIDALERLCVRKLKEVARLEAGEGTPVNVLNLLAQYQRWEAAASRRYGEASERLLGDPCLGGRSLIGGVNLQGAITAPDAAFGWPFSELSQDMQKRVAIIINAGEYLLRNGQLGHGPETSLARSLFSRIWGQCKPLVSEAHYMPHEAVARMEREVLGVCLPMVRLLKEVARMQDLECVLAGAKGTSTPQKGWLKNMPDLAAFDVDARELRKRLESLLDMRESTNRHEAGYNFGRILYEKLLPTSKALAWAGITLDSMEVGPALLEVAERSFLPLKGVGMLSEGLGMACVWALGNMKDGGGVRYLAQLRERVRYPKIRKRIDKVLDELTGGASDVLAEVMEAAFPDHGLAEGERRMTLDGGTAIIRLNGQGRLRLEWENAAGEPVKSVPAAVRRGADAGKVAALRARLKDIDRDIAALKSFLQGQYLHPRVLEYGEWRRRYVEHGTLGLLSRRLLWLAEKEKGAEEAVVVLPTAEGCEDVGGRAVDCDGRRMRLWHPLMSAEEEVRAWRERLLEKSVVQPFAQAWREVYRLTDAERETATYSNRFAGHVVKQHQALTLARLNGWEGRLVMWVDDQEMAPLHLRVPAHDLQAEFWVEGAGDPDDPPVLDSQAYIYLSTDRVKFHRLNENARWGRGAEVPLEEVPPMVFSEVMRVCDLIVSRASIARDPLWRDRGREADFAGGDWWRAAENYWIAGQEAALSEAGRMRREVLARLLPMLEEAERFRLEADHLRVRGNLNEYLVHLNSAGVLKLPERRHVCIVPKETRAPVMLPTEGDETLALVLSKALLLAHDDAVDDPVIRGQIA